MTKGILLIAINCDSFNPKEIAAYGWMTYNMCLSIKKNSNVHITILTDDNCFNSIPINQVSDDLIKVPICHLWDNKINPFKLKTYMYDYSPYEKTLYLDVDGFFFFNRNIDDLFKELENDSFQIQEVNRWEKKNFHECDMVWTGKVDKTLEDVYKAYNLPDRPYPEYNSSFVYFVKNDKNKKYFEQVKANYKDRRLPFKDVGGRYPDELAFNMASVQCDHYVDKKNYRPIAFWWENRNMTGQIHEANEKYWILGMAGGHTPKAFERMYNSLATKIGSPYNKWQNRKKIFHKK